MTNQTNKSQGASTPIGRLNPDTETIESNVEQVQQASNSKEILRVREELEKGCNQYKYSKEIQDSFCCGEVYGEDVCGEDVIKLSKLCKSCKSKLEGFNLGVSLGEKKGKEDALKELDLWKDKVKERSWIGYQCFMDELQELKEKIGVKS